MRICLLGRSTPIHIPGGFEKYLFDIARGLAELGHEVHVITKRLPTARKSEELTELDGFFLHWVGPRDSKFWYSFPFFFEMGKKVAQLHRERPFDIIHSNNLAAFSLYLVRPTDPWPPLVTTAHGTSVSEFMTQPKTIFQKIKRSPRLVPVIPPEYITFARSAKIICITPHIQELIGQMNHGFRKKSVVIYNGVQHRKFFPPGNFGIPDVLQEPVTILFTGLVSYSKGTPTLYRVFVHLSAKYPNLMLRIVGGGPQLEELKGEARRVRLEGRVKFDGYVTPDQMPEIYRHAHIFILPTEGLEGFSYSILEALSTGLPVIASTACHVGQLFQKNDCGLIFEAGNADQLTEKIEFLLANPGRGQELGRNGRDLVLRRFTLDGMAKKVERVYNLLLNQLENK